MTTSQLSGNCPQQIKGDLISDTTAPFSTGPCTPVEVTGTLDCTVKCRVQINFPWGVNPCDFSGYSSMENPGRLAEIPWDSGLSQHYPTIFGQIQIYSFQKLIGNIELLSPLNLQYDYCLKLRVEPTGAFAEVHFGLSGGGGLCVTPAPPPPPDNPVPAPVPVVVQPPIPTTLTCGPNSYSAPFRVSRDQSSASSALQNFAFVDGVLYYDWTKNALLLTYGINDYIELFLFNSANGISNKEKQILIQKASGTTADSPCGATCQKSKIKFEMPPFDRLPQAGSAFAKGGGTINVGGRTCTRYSIPSGGGFQISQIWLDGSNLVCRFTMDNGREYEVETPRKLSTCSFAVPASCTCQGMIDYIVLLDGSSSISATEWTSVNDWLRAFIASSTFGAKQGALSVVQFSGGGSSAPVIIKPGKPGIPLARSIDFNVTEAELLAAEGMVIEDTEFIDVSMKRCGDTYKRTVPSLKRIADWDLSQYQARVEFTLSSDSAGITQFFKSNLPKISGGTQVISGLQLIRKKVYPLLRAGATTVLITMTDGADGSGADLISEEIALHRGMGVNSFIGIAVGASVPTAQMNALTANTGRVYQYNDFANFKANMEDIINDACMASLASEASSCGFSCCGFCMCSTCVSPQGCDDGRACTAESLKGSGAFKCCSAPADTCSDSKCAAGTCQSDGKCASNPVPCASSDPCKVGSCTEATGCVLQDKCSTSDPCKVATCNGGTCGLIDKSCPKDTKCMTYACKGGDCVGTKVNCDDGDPCTADSCSDATGCTYAPQACTGCCNGKVDTACEKFTCDMGVCKSQKLCAAGPDPANPCQVFTGECSGDGKSCATKPLCAASADPCVKVSCENGKCVEKPALVNNDPCKFLAADNGGCVIKDVTCPAGDACNSWSCSAGKCVNNKKSCDDGNACTTDTCHPTTGVCSSVSNCDDSDACTVDSCGADGKCVFTPLCPASTDPCLQSVCSAGTCSTKTVPCTGNCGQQSCDDSNKCTRDYCDGATGVCKNDATCTTTDPCLVPNCDPKVGGCTFDVKPCTAPNKCTVSKCVGGQCVDSPLDCDDKNPCTLDSCEVTKGCLHEPLCPAWANCKDVKCVIEAGQPKCVADTKCFTDNTCMEAVCTNDVCDQKPVACPPSNACVSYTCLDGKCAEKTTDCDDRDPCTKDTCDPTSGCKHEQQACPCTPSTPSDICVERTCFGGVTTETPRCVPKTEGCWTITGKCDLTNGCEKTSACVPQDGVCGDGFCENDVCVVRPIVCDDGNPCTTDVCEGNTCVFKPKCDAIANKCTSATCVPETGECVTKDISKECDDHDLCTRDSCDPNLGCQHTNTSASCAGDNPCVLYTCDPLRGCVSAPRVCPNAPPCSVGVCVNGTCALQKPFLCDKDVAVVAGVGAGAIVGIAAGIVACLALSGAAAYKGYQALHATEEDFAKAGTNSPIYEMAELGGQSKIYQGGDYTRL